jgi:hypothetical protein
MLDVGFEAFCLKQTGDTDFDDELYAQFDALLEKNGYESPNIDIEFEWEEEDLPTLYPKLWARFGENPLLY